MPLFKIDNDNKLEYIKEDKFKFEKDIQTLTEANLESIFELEFVKTEFSINQFRIDTLAFDKETNSFVIIEYKRDKNYSVIDQGYAYLSLMLNNKSDFILEYNENSEAILKRNDVDWSQSKVIFLSPSFTTYQREAINFKDLPIELWEVKRFKNKTVSYTQIKTSGSKESINTISKQDKTIEEVGKEIKVFTEQEHIDKIEDGIKEIYKIIKESICNFDDNISINPKKYFIGFQVNKKSFTDIVLLKKGLKIYLNLKSGELEDTRKISRDVSNVGHWGNGAYEIQMKDDSEIEYILSLIKQALRKIKEFEP